MKNSISIFIYICSILCNFVYVDCKASQHSEIKDILLLTSANTDGNRLKLETVFDYVEDFIDIHENRLSDVFDPTTNSEVVAYNLNVIKETAEPIANNYRMRPRVLINHLKKILRAIKDAELKNKPTDLNEQNLSYFTNHVKALLIISKRLYGK